MKYTEGTELQSKFMVIMSPNNMKSVALNHYLDTPSNAIKQIDNARNGGKLTFGIGYNILHAVHEAHIMYKRLEELSLVGKQYKQRFQIHCV